MVYKSGDVVLQTGFGYNHRHTHTHTLSKVTFGIWVVTHSSAGERLGSTLL